MPQTHTIPTGWKETRLGDVVKINELSIDKNYPHTEIEYLDTASADQGTIVGTQLLKLKDAPSRARRIIRDNDILISTVRPNLRHYALIKKSKPNLIGSTGFAIISPTDSNSRFLYYLLSSREYTDFLTKIADGHTSAYPSFNPDVISNSIKALPPLAEQKEIAAVLGVLDDKIELLKAQNKTLEGMAQALFKQWFVKFDFPDALGRPYRSSGGKMIDSDLGEIPAGWRVGNVSDLINIKSGFAFSSADFKTNGKFSLITIKNVQDRCFDPNTKDKLDNLPSRMPEYCRLKSGDILLSLTGNIGRICLTLEGDFLLNQRVAKLAPVNPSDWAYAYMYFLQEEIFANLQSLASGTAQQNLSPVLTQEMETAIPNRSLLDDYGTVANPLIEKIVFNNNSMVKFSMIRDNLLPELMRGEVRV